MKNIIIGIVVVVLGFNGILSLYNWLFSSDDQYSGQPALAQPIIPPESDAGEGLELELVTSMAKEIRGGQELERRINEKGGINNLDLDGNEKVDYIKVTEFGNTDRKIGYSLSVEPKKDETQEIATITVEKNGDKAEIQVVGNEQIYGKDAIYNDWAPIERTKSSTVTDQTVHVHHSYFAPRPLWFSPFYFGFYPSYYSFYPIVTPIGYASRTTTYRSPTTQRGGNSFQKRSNQSISSPNKGKTANSGITRSLKSPTGTQKKFQASASAARKTRSGGFGRSSGSTGSTTRSGGFGRSSSSVRSSSSSSSRSFGFSGK